MTAGSAPYHSDRFPQKGLSMSSPFMSPRLTAAIALIAPTLTILPAYAADWSVQPEASTIDFAGTLGGSTVAGSFGSFEADITLDPEALDAASVTILIDTGSVTTDSDTANGALPGVAWFDASSFPQARFTSDTITATDGGYLATGTLQIRDQSAEIELPFTLDIEGDTAQARGETVLDRTNFGVGTGAFAAESPVAHEVTVTFDLTATRS